MTTENKIKEEVMDMFVIHEGVMGKSTANHYKKIINFTIFYTLKTAIEEIEKYKKDLQKELTRIVSLVCKTPDEAIEQRITLERLHVEISHFDEILKSLQQKASKGDE